jgi:hypothetical protein
MSQDCSGGDVSESLSLSLSLDPSVSLSVSLLISLSLSLSLFISLFLFWGRVSVHNPGSPQTQSLCLGLLRTEITGVHISYVLSLMHWLRTQNLGKGHPMSWTEVTWLLSGCISWLPSEKWKPGNIWPSTCNRGEVSPQNNILVWQPWS